MIKKNISNFKNVDLLSNFFKVMGDTTRLQLLITLQNGELCVSELSKILDMTLSAISHQLKILKMAHLVKSRKEGKAVYYSLDDDHIYEVLEKSIEHIEEK